MTPDSRNSNARDRTSDPGAVRRRLAARIGGIALHLHHDSNAIAARARAGLFAKFERMADPEGMLDRETRLKRAKMLMRQHMSRLALKSIQKRTKSPTGRDRAPSAADRPTPSDTSRSS